MSAPAAYVAVPLLAGVVIGSLVDVLSIPCALVALTLAWIAACASLGRRDGVLLAAACGAGCFCAGAIVGARAERAIETSPLIEWLRTTRVGDPVTVRGTLREDAGRTSNGVSITVDVDTIEAGNGSRRLDGGVRLEVLGSLALRSLPAWRAGRAISLPATLREPIDYRDPGVPSDRDRLARQGIALLGSVKSAALATVEPRGPFVSEAAGALRARVRTATADAVGHWSAASAGVVTAVLIGDRTGLSPEDERRLQDAGTYHVIAISGENIALLTAMLIALGRLLRFPSRAVAVASIAVLLFYGYTAGLAPSVLRATVAGVIYLSARAADHRGSVVNALSVAAAFAAVTVPLTAFDPGFLLSFGATLAILVAVTRAPPVGRDRHATRASAIGRWVWTEARALGAATLCAEVALAPIAARLFGRVTFAGVILNFAAIPLMSMIEAAGIAAVICASLWRAPALALGWIAHIATVALLGSASLVDRAPWLVVDVPAPSILVVTAWYAAWAVVLGSTRAWARRGAVAVIVLCGALILRAPPSTSASGVPRPPDGWSRITVLDVGQGDATLVWPARGRPLLVDAGGAPGSSFDLGRRVTLPAAWGFRARALGALALTHGDPDHIGGAPAVMRALAPAEIWDGVPVPRFEPLRLLRDAAARASIPWVARRTGQVIAWGAASIRVLNPPDPDWERQKVRNDDSIVLDVRIGSVSIVLPGDISRAVEPSIARAFERAPLVILKVPHHGSAGSSSPGLVDALRPSIAIVSAGRRNPFGHPAPAVVDRYRAAGAQIFSTADDGAVVVDTNGTDVHVWGWASRRELWLRAR